MLKYMTNEFYGEPIREVSKVFKNVKGIGVSNEQFI
jgi:hypothetical protein